jgi:hypothetical protein
LPFISGSTNFGNGDSRDSNCVKITDPSNFSITTDADSDGNASTTFDSRLYLFDKKGKPLLFNDDGISSLASTLTSVTTDGSGYILTQPGEYTPVVTGFSDDPLDNVGTNLFNQAALLLHAPIPNSNHFSAWENSSPATGDYFIALQGVSYCQDKLDIVGTGSNLNLDTQLCSGDGNGGFDSCHNDNLDSEKSAISTGYLDNDEHLDVIFDSFTGDIPSVCLGDGVGGYRSCFVYAGTGTDRTQEAIFGDINNDNLTDVVFIASGGNHKACLGNGLGSYSGCSDIANSDSISNGAQLAFMDADSNLDLVFSDFFGLNICLGDGMGSFAACNRMVIEIYDIQAVDVNKDGNTDIVGISDGNTNKVCINDGGAGLTCNDINAETNRTFGLSMADLNNDGNIDVVFANVNGVSLGVNKVCLGDGNSGFNCSNVSGISADYTAVKLGLLNDDNFLDAVFACNTFTRICTGIGDGTFSNCVNDTSLPLFDIELGEFGQRPPDAMFSDSFE